MRQLLSPDGAVVQEVKNPSHIWWITGTGQVLTTHSAGQCAGEHCVVHNPSDHHMRHLPTNWRMDSGITERICPHGVGHPDPDEISPDTTHGCDGCCTPPGDDHDD